MSRERLYDENLLFYELDKLPFYRTYYIRLYINKDVLESASVCFVTDKEYCFTDDDSADGYEQNIEILRSQQSHFEYCNFNDTDSYCQNSDGVIYSISISPGNVVIVNRYGAGCWVNRNDKLVRCNE